MLAILAQRSATTQQLAAELGEENLAIVNYHLKVLHRCGDIVPDPGQGGGGGGLYRAKR